jgi:hypothetical protein
VPGAGKDYGDAVPGATGNATAHDEDRIVNGYSVDGRPWYVALQVPTMDVVFTIDQGEYI